MSNPRTIAKELPPEAEEIRRRLRREKAELRRQEEKVRSTHAELWVVLQRHFDLDLDGCHYQIDADGQLLQVLQRDRPGDTSTRVRTRRDPDSSLH